MNPLKSTPQIRTTPLEAWAVILTNFLSLLFIANKNCCFHVSAVDSPKRPSTLCHKTFSLFLRMIMSSLDFLVTNLPKNFLLETGKFPKFILFVHVKCSLVHCNIFYSINISILIRSKLNFQRHTKSFFHRIICMPTSAWKNTHNEPTCGGMNYA